MTQQEKDVLLKDLCGRLPYGVKCKLWSEDNECAAITEPLKIGGLDAFMCNNSITIKPYLRPMSSMTEKEIKHFFGIRGKNLSEDELKPYRNKDLGIVSTFGKYARNIDLLNAHHFDYRGLIEKGLAIAVTEENNPYKS